MKHAFNTKAKKEFAILALCAIVLLVAIVPSLIHARREYRDGLVRQHVAHLKRILEDSNNKLGYYPVNVTKLSILPNEYYVTKPDGKKAVEWFVRGTVENYHAPTTAYDAEEGNNFWYRYVSAPHKTYFEICGGTPDCRVAP